MMRLMGVLVILGIGLAGFGVRDVWLNFGVSSTPVQLDLAALENGGESKDENVVIGPHVALYPFLVYETSDKKQFGDEPITYSIYPIMSVENEDLKKILQGERSIMGSRSPWGEEDPGPGNFAVLVKSYRFKNTSQVPMMLEPRDEIQGMVINNIDELDEEMRKFIAKSFPTVNINSVLVVEEGRQPSILRGILMIFGGIAMVGVAVTLALFTSGDSDE